VKQIWVFGNGLMETLKLNILVSNLVLELCMTLITCIPMFQKGGLIALLDEAWYALGIPTCKQHRFLQITMTTAVISYLNSLLSDRL